MRLGLIGTCASVLFLQALLASWATAQSPAGAPPAPVVRVEPQVLLRQAVAEMQRLMQVGRKTEAVRIAERAYEQLQFELGPEHPLTAVALANFGFAQRQAGAIDEAIVELQRALALEAKLGSPSRESFRRVLKELSDVERARGQGDIAVTLYDAALERLRLEGAGSMAEAELLDEQGALLRHLGAFARAQTQLQASLAIKYARLAPTDMGLLGTLTQLAGVSRLNGHHGEAERLYKIAIDLVAASKGEKDPNLAIVIDNLGVLYSGLGRHAEAEVQHKRALAIFEESLGREHVSTGQCAGNLGASLFQQRRFEEAEKLLLRAIDIFSRTLPANDWRIGVAHDNLAGVYRNQRQYERAIESYHKALDILRKAYSETHPDVGTALNNLAVMNTEINRLPQAERFAGEALVIAEKTHGESHIHVAHVLNTMGSVQARQGRNAEARATFERSIAIIEREMGNAHGLLLHPLSQLGDVLLSLGEAQPAYAAFQRAAAIELQQRARDAAVRINDGPVERADPFIGLVQAAWLLESGDGKAGGRAEESFGHAQWIMQSSVGKTVAQLGARLGARTPALAALARERLDLAEEWVRVDKGLTAILSMPSTARATGDDAAQRQRLAAIDARLAQIDATLSKEHPGFAELAQPTPLTVKDTRALLTPGEALLAFVPTEQHVYVWLVTRTEVRWRRADLPAADIARKVRALRCGLDQGEWINEERSQRCRNLLGRGLSGDALPFDTGIAVDLYRALIAPFAPALEGKHVLVAAAGVLTSLPLQVLLVEAPKDGKLAKAAWFGLRNAMTTLPSVASLKSLRKDARASGARKPYFGIGNPLLIGPDKDYSAAWGAQSCLAAQMKRRPAPIIASADASTKGTLMRGGAIDVEAVRMLNPLPETRDELCAVAASAGAGEIDLALGSRASEKHVRDLNASGALRSYRIVHFATHGLVAGDVAGLSEAALVLTPPAEASPDNDGLLTASEVASLKLDADWVILSACNTAAGNNLGAVALSGLARAFFHAGARALLVSHWPVQSVAAVKLTTRALAEMKKSPGLGRAEALRRSMTALMADPSDPLNGHPQVWAPFVVVGEGAGGLAATPVALGPALPAVAGPGDAVAKSTAVREGVPATKGKANRPAVAAVPAGDAKRAAPAPSTAPRAGKQPTPPTPSGALPVPVPPADGAADPAPKAQVPVKAGSPAKAAIPRKAQAATPVAATDAGKASAAPAGPVAKKKAPAAPAGPVASPVASPGITGSTLAPARPRAQPKAEPSAGDRILHSDQ